MRRDREATLSPEARRELAALDAALGGRAVEPGMRDLEQLAALLVTDRPVPRAEFLRALDERVTAGFPRRRDRVLRRVSLSRPKLTRRMLAPAFGTAASVVLVVAVIVSATQDNGSGGGTQATKTFAEPAAVPTAAPKASTFSSDAETTTAAPASAGSGAATARPRKVERSATLSLTTPRDKVEDVSQQVIETTDRFSGIVANSSISSNDVDGGSSSFELKLPTSRLDAALAALSKLAHVKSRTQDSLDVTAQVVSARDRLSQALAERKALLRQLAKAPTQTAIDAIRERLRLNAVQVAADRRAVRSLALRTDYSTVEVSVAGDGTSGGAGGGGTWTPGDALHDAGQILAVALGVVLIGLALGLPLLVLGGAAGLGTRAARRRRREQALNAF